MSEEITKRLPEPVPSAPLQSSLDRNPIYPQGPRRRLGRRWPFVLALLTLVLGFILGVVASLIFVLGHSTHTAPLVTTSTQSGNILVQAQPALLTLITEKSLPSAGIPGTFTNIHFQLANGDRMTMTGTYTYSIFGIGLTSFVTAFVGKINQELKLPSSGLPDGLTYCMSGVHTETSGLYVTVKVTSK
jgi:hypothetical protein